MTLRDTGEQLEVDPAWVIVAPPDFAPSIGNVVTLLDVVEQAVSEARELPAPTDASFERDILPLLHRVAANQWVDAAAFRGHRRGDQDPTNPAAVERRGDFLDQALLKQLADPSAKAKDARQRVFDHIRAPWSPDEPSDPAAEKRAKDQATAKFMPPLSGDLGDRIEGTPGTWLTVTPLQYRLLELWAQGEFAPPAEDGSGALSQDGDVARPTPADLDRAALENCVGGGFFPGIEVSRRIKELSLYVAGGSSAGDRYRLNHENLWPGALTERMAVPWQADFAQCEGFWWPAQRPDHVIAEEDYQQVLHGAPETARPGPFLDTVAYPRRPWARGIGNRPRSTASVNPLVRRRHDMVDRWSELGFVVPRDDRGVKVWTERERARYLGLQDRDYFHIMLNLDHHPEFRPVAKELADWFIADAQHKLDHDEDLDTELHFFAYDEATFETRLGSIYRFLVDQVAVYDPAADGTFYSADDVIERIKQYAPLNQTDGVWLRNIDKVPPIAGVTDLLEEIWKDENGRGDPKYNHSNMYTKLMRDVGLKPAPVTSLEYARDPELFDSAFTAPLLQLVVSEFSAEFLPEILGMTLHFEWESVWLKTNAMLFSHFGIDPTFYVTHLAIDNVAEGHGALAVRAVKRYLADFRGDELQQQWRRIWVGYVAFREAGTLFADLRAKLRPNSDRAAIKARMMEMIERKKPFGNLNHGRLTDSTMTNDLFDDPEHMLNVLAADKNLVIPGWPNDSRLLSLFKIDGPMYRVFTEDEQDLWREWILSLPAPEVPQRAAGPGTAPGGGAPRHYSRLTLSSPEAAFRADPRPQLRGRGAVQ